jgi:hypothetical protein
MRAKFRIWDKKNNCFQPQSSTSGEGYASVWGISINGEVLCFGGEKGTLKMYKKGDPNFVIQRSVGFAVNGRGLFEGDVVRTIYGQIGAVHYESTMATFHIVNGAMCESMMSDRSNVIRRTAKEILGNIFENPDWEKWKFEGGKILLKN